MDKLLNSNQKAKKSQINDLTINRSSDLITLMEDDEDLNFKQEERDSDRAFKEELAKQRQVR